MPKRIASTDTSVKAQSKKTKQNPGRGIEGENVVRGKVKSLGDADKLKSKKPPEPKNNQKCLGKRKIKVDVEEKPAKLCHFSEASAPGWSRPKSKKKESCGVLKKEPVDGKQNTGFKSFPSIPKFEEVCDEDKVIKAESNEDESEDEWEDVEDLHEAVSEVSTGHTFPETALQANPVEIEIETPEQAKKRQQREKRKDEFQMYLRRMLNRCKKELQVDTHKVHLLCLIANGIYRNRICNITSLQATALSIIPAQFTKLEPACVDLLFLTNLVKWFVSVFSINTELSVLDGESMQSRLERRFGNYSVKDEEELVHVFLIILRALQLMCRLVLSFQPIPLKEPTDKSKKSPGSFSRKSSGSSRKTHSISKKSASSKLLKTLKQERCVSDNSDEDAEVENEKQQSCFVKKDTSNSKPRTAAKKTNMSSSGAASLDAKGGVGLGPKNDRRRRVASKVCYKEEGENDDNSDSDFELSDAESSNFSDDDMENTFANKKLQTGPQKKRILKEGRKEYSVSGKAVSKSSVDSTAKEEEPKETLPKVKKLSSKSNKIISSDEDDDLIGQAKVAKGLDNWVEVYVEREEKWVCIDCVHGSVNQPQLCYKYATKPIFYIIGIDSDGFIRDITQRYDAVWMTVTRKLRVDPAWWQQTLEPYRSPFNKREEKEDLQLQAKLLDQPLPKSVNEYKNHPLYALKRHLLKFQAIYPSTATVLGYCRGEAVYSRDCVHTLHSRDTWLKEARVVRLGEVPYKMVKGQSNRARKARLAEPESSDKDDLSLFGLWQTEEYQPPVAVDGKVPRNEYGNVYLFKTCMLPVGCVHLQVPNLHRVARKLNIDCATAVSGFDFHAGYSHPVIDGYVVCEEYKDILLTAWENEQAEIERKEKEKREKRALANWKLLVKGLLIRERLKQRYGNKDGMVRTIGQEGGGDGFSSDEEVPGSHSAANDASCSWPENRKAEEQETGKIGRMSRREKRGEEKHLFPFEK